MNSTELANTARRDTELRPTGTSRVDDKHHPQPTLPAVDIFEDAGGITLLADMPGVSRDALDVRLDGDALAIEGTVTVPANEGLRALWAEIDASKFRRTFTLSRELDASRIEANLKDGVLSVRIPKQAQAQRRRIAVQAS